MTADVPLIVPEVNADAVKGFSQANIIANPNCSTAQLVVALKPLHDAATIKRVVVATYQSVSGAGKDAMDELFEQTKRRLHDQRAESGKKFPKRIAFNVIPHIDVFMEDGYDQGRVEDDVETKKILDPKIRLTATCVRVPVFVGHSEAVNVEFENPITADEARDILRNGAGCAWSSTSTSRAATSRRYEAAGEDATYVSRIREDHTVENGLSFWCVSDNLRKGAALNAVQIAEVPDQSQADHRRRRRRRELRASRGRNCNDGTAGSLPPQSAAQARRAWFRKPALQQPLADGAVLFRPRRQPRGAVVQVLRGAVGVHRPRAGLQGIRHHPRRAGADRPLADRQS